MVIFPLKSITDDHIPEMLSLNCTAMGQWLWHAIRSFFYCTAEQALDKKVLKALKEKLKARSSVISRRLQIAHVNYRHGISSNLHGRFEIKNRLCKRADTII